MDVSSILAWPVCPILAILLGSVLLILLVWVIVTDCADASPQASADAKERVRETAAQIQQTQRQAQHLMDQLSDQYLEVLYQQYTDGLLDNRRTRR